MRTTIQDIMQSRDLCITPKAAADVLDCSPDLIRYMARNDAEKLGFPVIIVGTRVKIPRIPFLKYIGLIEDDTAP